MTFEKLLSIQILYLSQYRVLVLCNKTIIRLFESRVSSLKESYLNSLLILYDYWHFVKV